MARRSLPDPRPLVQEAEQVLEVARVQVLRDAAHGLALRGARRPDHEQMLAHQRDQLHQRFSLDEPAPCVRGRCPQRRRRIDPIVYRV